MEFLAGLFVGIAFWEIFFVFAFFGLGILAAEWESTGVFALGLVGSLLGLHFLTDVNVWEIITTQPFMLALFGLGYILIGGVYAMFVTWPEYLRDNSRDIQHAKSSWLSNYNKDNKTELKGLDDEMFEKFIASYEYSDYRASRNIERIGNFMVTWFFDAVWKAIHKPVRWAWETTYNMFARGFSSVGKRVTKTIIND